VTVAAIVAAAGRGHRLAAAAPKALVPVAGAPLVVHAVSTVRAAGADVVIVTAPADYVAEVAALVPDAQVIIGGALRQDSVALALRELPPSVDVVLVHDAARGLAPASLVEAVIGAVRAGAEAVVPVVPLSDTVKEVDGSERVVRTLDRSQLRIVQTPQGFARDVLQRAHDGSSGVEMTDDAAMVEALGVAVTTVPGAALAMKVTTPTDLVIAEALVAAEANRVG